ncbi:MAG: hypothetical protein HY774_06375 [Acidobacteria bacterium]|nr:hypothetical protein [Acidobacteriota bacterium]
MNTTPYISAIYQLWIPESSTRLIGHRDTHLFSRFIHGSQCDFSQDKVGFLRWQQFFISKQRIPATGDWLQTGAS